MTVPFAEKNGLLGHPICVAFSPICVAFFFNVQMVYEGQKEGVF